MYIKKIKNISPGSICIDQRLENVIAHLEKFVKARCWETSVVYSTIIYLMF